MRCIPAASVRSDLMTILALLSAPQPFPGLRLAVGAGEPSAIATALTQAVHPLLSAFRGSPTG